MDEAEVIHLTLPDGSQRAVRRGATPLEVAAGIGRRLAADAVGAELDGEKLDLRAPLGRGGAFRIFTAKNPESGEFIRHSTEHVLADAVKRLWPEVEIDVGRKDHSEKYQYDFRFPRPFTPEDLERIEAKMREIVAEGAELERIEVSREEAERTFRAMGERLKVERLQEIPRGETITLYRHGAFTDLCRGPHAQRVSQIGAVKLLESSAVYWKGDEANERLQRIYGTAFATPDELERWLEQAEQARARDHRRLGPELDLFSFHPAAPASPFFHPKGAFVYNALAGLIRELQERSGFAEVVTPQILDVELWHTSGHWDHYREAMFFTALDERQFAVKPMNCPGHCLIYRTALRSYRDLPIRYADFGRLHRYEKSGVVSGLTRVRSFAQDDSHSFVLPEQIAGEVQLLIGMILELYALFAFGDVRIELSTRPEKRLGDDATWDRAEQALADALERSGMPYELNPGEGNFYGPKIDFHVRDVLGRSWQLGTVQLDYQMPERFGLAYVGPDGAEHAPVMIHSAKLGSIERFLGILIEHTGGAFPVWLAPVQAMVVPVSEKCFEYAASLHEKLRKEDVRVELDASNEKLGFKIRRAQLQKVPYMLVVGNREQESCTVAVRLRSGEDLGAILPGEFLTRLKGRVASRSAEL
ncbi:MAG TPA: threonine--tRNA ligase [Thermoanaerobaculia bacterium]|nr:threonine--tRNA ligase [Thermoanaerobaculia bacterium]